MADIFNTQGNKATQAVIDAASKILMGVNDSETAKAQTEEEHPAIDPKNQELGEAKMSSKDFESNMDEINKAMRSGKFIYDISGNAR